MVLPVLKPLPDDLYLVRGRKQVLALAPLLQDLTRSTGQLGAMHWLEYFFRTRSRVSKPPSLVLQLSRPRGSGLLYANDIRSAALFFEYQIAGLRTRVFSTDDAVGYRTIIAAPGEQERFACRAAQALLESGAHIVLANYKSTEQHVAPSTTRSNVLADRRERCVPRALPLLSTFESTLANFGHTTRFNLRYYRRRLSKRMQLEFVEDARHSVTATEFHALNGASLNPLADMHEVQLRWDSSTSLPGSFVVGLRSSAGQWLSLIGGWRQETTTVLHWQLNIAGYEKDSIGTVMRSFFLEHEIARGARELLIYGGTPHSIAHAFKQDTIADLVLCRDSFRSRLVRRAAIRLTRRDSSRPNHLLCSLSEIDLHRVPTERLTALRPLCET